MEQGKGSVTSYRSQTWTRRYPPITVALLAGVLIALMVLPSALNIPQTNPTTIAEYAPVPPEDDAPPDTTGNVSALGLGSSSSLQRALPTPVGDLTSPAQGERRQNQRCVGKPARQTEDPMSPPCVPFFDGNNGGATWTGVTKDEIRIVLPTLNGGGARCTPKLCSSATPQGTLCDLDKPPNTDPNCRGNQDTEDHWEVQATRPVLRHFNLRYQTYDRRVHLWIYWGGGGGSAAQRAAAADVYDKIKPFAVIPIQGFFSQAMAARRVMSFGGSGIGFELASAFTRHSPYLWGFNPDIEHRVEGYAGYVCSKVAGRPVTHTDGLHIDGSPMKNTPRRYAFMYTSEANPNLQAFKDQVRPKLKECGIEPATEVEFPVAGAVASPRTDGSYAITNVAKMQDERVTTVLWFGGLETYTGQRADERRFYPEIVIASDGHLDGLLGADFQNQNWFRHAWGPTPLLFTGNLLEEHPAYQACREGDPNASHEVCELAAGNFRSLFMAFKAIQASGPRLTPASVDRGLHSIPRIASTHPMLAACFFDPGDYTCVKDSVEQWWDPDALSPYWQGTGCFRMSNGGTRYLPGGWPERVYAFQNTQDPCGSWLGGATIN